MDYTLNIDGIGAVYLDVSDDNIALQNDDYTAVDVYAEPTTQWEVNGVPQGAIRGDLALMNGDFARGDTLLRNIYLILCTMAGAWKNAGVCGAGIQRWMRGVPSSVLLRDIEVALHADGYAQARVVMSNDNVINIQI